jgi:transposase
VKERRQAWIDEQPNLDVRRLVFLDESGAKTNMTRLRGRAKGGARVLGAVPSGHWSTTTMISSIRANGETACLSVDGPTSSEVFREYIRQVLAPKLHPGDLVILDNLSSHKDSQALALIAAQGAQVLFLPPYSPDLNPIEKMWSKVKEHLRSAQSRTRDALDIAIGFALDSITAQDAQGWFKSCGYSIN